MFWGANLKKGSPYKLADHTASSLLHVSNLALASSNENSGKTTVWAQTEGKKILLATLEEGKAIHASLDLYFRVEQDVQFSVEGKGEVFLAGYYEPETEGEDWGEDDEEASDEEVDAKNFKALVSKGKKGPVDASSESDEGTPKGKAQGQKGQSPAPKGPQAGSQQKPGQQTGAQQKGPVVVSQQKPAQQAGAQQKPAQQVGAQVGAQPKGPQAPSQQKPGPQAGQQKPGPQAGSQQKKPAKPEISDEDDEDLDEEIDDDDLELGDDDEDDLELGDDDDDSDEEPSIKKHQKTNGGIPNVKQDLNKGGKPQQGGKPQGGQQGGKPHGGQQGGKPQGGQHGGKPHGGQQGGKPHGGQQGGKQHNKKNKNKRQH